MDSFHAILIAAIIVALLAKYGALATAAWSFILVAIGFAVVALIAWAILVAGRWIGLAAWLGMVGCMVWLTVHGL